MARQGVRTFRGRTGGTDRMDIPPDALLTTIARVNAHAPKHDCFRRSAARRRPSLAGRPRHCLYVRRPGHQRESPSARRRSPCFSLVFGRIAGADLLQLGRLKAEAVVATVLGDTGPTGWPETGKQAMGLIRCHADASVKAVAVVFHEVALEEK